MLLNYLFSFFVLQAYGVSWWGCFCIYQRRRLPTVVFLFLLRLEANARGNTKNTIYKEDVSITQQESDNETVQKDPLGKYQCYFAIFLNPTAFLLLHL